ncbi:MAG: choice-of-anchor B family protein [Bacteroidota bacterium]
MRNILAIALLFMWVNGAAQSPELVGQRFFPGITHSNGDTTGVSDVWGYQGPDGTEYAIVGTFDGTFFIRVSDMTVRGFVPGPRLNDYYYHRDIKTYRHHAYIVSEMNGTNEGVQVVDLSTLPNGVQLDTVLTGQTITSHNLSIDTTKGFMYVLNQFGQGVWIYDLAVPSAPAVAGFINEPGVHDLYADNDTIWMANSIEFLVADVKDKSDPNTILRLKDDDFGYCHNIWPCRDRNFFVTTEETDDKTVKIWSMEDPDSAFVVSEYLAPNRIAHNAHVEGDSLYISHYASGIKIVDISDLKNPQEVGGYDTYLANDNPGFYGCWGIYPHSPAGYIFATSFEGWLHVLQFPQTPTSIEDEFRPAAKLAVPSPFSSRLHLIGSAEDVTIFDIQGKVWWRQSFTAPSQVVETSSWPAGMYIVQGKQGVQRVVKVTN